MRRAELAERHGLDAADIGPEACTIDTHQRLKSDAARVEEETVHLGWQDDGDGGLLRLVDCVRCGSTLVLE